MKVTLKLSDEVVDLMLNANPKWGLHGVEDWTRFHLFEAAIGHEMMEADDPAARKITIDVPHKQIVSILGGVVAHLARARSLEPPPVAYKPAEKDEDLPF